MTNPTPTDVNTLIERLEKQTVDLERGAGFTTTVPDLLCIKAAQALRAMQARVGALEEAISRARGEIWNQREKADDYLRSTQQEAQRHG